MFSYSSKGRDWCSPLGVYVAGGSGGGYFGDGAKEISPAMGTVRAARPRRAWEKETASFLCLYPGFSSYKDLSKMIVG